MEGQPYSDIVMDHFLHPRNVGEIPDANGIGNVGNPVCVTPDTLIYANSKALAIKDIKNDIKVLGHDGKYHKVNRVYKRFFQGNIYSLEINNLGSTKITGEHHVLALRRHNELYKMNTPTRYTPDWCLIKELRKGDIILYPLLQETQDLDTIQFDIHKPRYDFKRKTLPQSIKVNHNFLLLVGYYLSGGYVRIDKGKGTIGFVFNKNEKHYIDETIALMEKIFGLSKKAKSIINKNGSAVEICFYSAGLSRFFAENFGKDALNKRLPHWMMLLPVEKQRSILCGLFRVGGYIDQKGQRVKYVTVSQQLAYQIKLLLLRQKIIANFCEGKAGGIQKKNYLYIQDNESLRRIYDITGINIKIKDRQRNMHRSWVDDNFYYTTIRKIKLARYNGWVYNLDVDEVHSYVSNSLVLHNCGDIMRMYIKVENNIITDAKFKTFGCLPAKEKVVSSQGGWIDISNVSKAETVINSEGKETLVGEVYKRNYKGKLFTLIPFVSPFNSFSVTSEHPIYCIKGEWIKGARHFGKCAWPQIEDNLFSTKPDFVKANQLGEGDYLIFNVNREVKDNDLFTQDVMRLMGYYLSKGAITAKGGVVAFTFHKKDKELIKNLKVILEKVVGKKPKSRTLDNLTEVYTGSRKLARFLTTHCKKIARDKSLSKEVLLLPFSKQWEMIKTYIEVDSDNYRHKSGNSQTYRIITTAQDLAIQMQEILARGGIFASIRQISKTDCYYLISFTLERSPKSVHYNGKYFFVPIKKINREDFKGVVYNLQVFDESHSYLVKGFAVHNCGAAISTSSMVTEMVKGKSIDEALTISNQAVAEALGGLPPIKMHCSVLAEEALKAALRDYYQKSGKELPQSLKGKFKDEHHDEHY